MNVWEEETKSNCSTKANKLENTTYSKFENFDSSIIETAIDPSFPRIIL
jgi:hypothetical protein